MSLFKTTILITLFLVSLFVLTFITGCISITDDLTQKTIAGKFTKIGIEITTPDFITSTVGSVISLRLGYFDGEYTSAPKGGKASIDKEYRDFNIWKLTGTTITKVGVENIGDVSEDAPVKG